MLDLFGLADDDEFALRDDGAPASFA